MMTSNAKKITPNKMCAIVTIIFISLSSFHGVNKTVLTFKARHWLICLSILFLIAHCCAFEMNVSSSILTQVLKEHLELKCDSAIIKSSCKCGEGNSYACDIQALFIWKQM